MTMFRREVDNDLINTIKGNQLYDGLSELKVKLSLIQAACTLALEGTIRATASQVSARAIKDYGIEASPSYTGQAFSALGIGSVTSHGKSRFVLDHNSLEKIRVAINAQCEELAKKLESTIAEFKTMPDKIQSLQSAWRDVQKMRGRERELAYAISEDRKTPNNLPNLEIQYKNIKQKAERVEEIKKECQTLIKLINNAPKLEEKKKSLEATIAEQAAEEKALEVKEKEIAAKDKWLTATEAEHSKQIAVLQKRTGWVELAQLTEAIASSKEELNQLSKQLGEKRSLLDKLLHRKEGNQ